MASSRVKVMSVGTWRNMAERMDNGEACPQCGAEWVPAERYRAMDHAEDCLWIARYDRFANQ